MRGNHLVSTYIHNYRNVENLDMNCLIEISLLCTFPYKSELRETALMMDTPGVESVQTGGEGRNGMKMGP